MPFSAPAQTLHIAADAVTVQSPDRTPFTLGDKVLFDASTGGDIAHFNHPGDANQAKFARFKPGATTAGDSITVPTVLNVMDDQAILDITTPAIRLRVVAVKNPRIDGGTVLVRVGNDETPSTGQFQQTDGTHIVLGDNTVASDEIDLYVMDAADISTTTLVAGHRQGLACPSFVVGDGTAVVDVYAEPHC